MSHDITVNINVEEVMRAEPIKTSVGLKKVCWFFVMLATVAFVTAIFSGYPAELAWGAYYTNLCFFMGIASGGVIIAAIFQIVRAKWSPPVRRITEANIAFLPLAWCLFICTWFGKEHIWVWAQKPMPGREWWMEPSFVFIRFGLLLAFMFFMMWRFVKMSLRSDIGVLRENQSTKPHWGEWIYQHIARNWRGSDVEIKDLQRKLSWNAPLLVFIYVIVYSLFSFEMVMGMDEIWYSNLFGAFEFIGNIYVGWAVLALLVMRLASRSSTFAKSIEAQQLWDLGKLTFGFCMLWGYMFFSQFLPQWYGNLPEETQWMITRTRIAPWWGLGWFTFAACFIVPFITLISEDIKRTPKAFAVICALVFIGVWFERYMIIMPQLSPDRIPASLPEIVLQLSLFLGFLGAYILCIRGFISKVPFITFSHPLARGSRDW